MSNSARDETPAILWPPTSLKSLFVGDYDWRYYFWPLSLYGKSRDGKASRDARKYLRFVKSDECVPLLFFVLTGLQYLTASFCHILLPAFVLTTFPLEPFGDYFIQAAFIISAIGTAVHCMKFRVPRIPFQIGSGMGSVLGNSMMSATLFVQLMMRIVSEEGGSYREAYGKLLGTSAVCSLLLLALALIPRKLMKRAFPPLVSGLIIALIGIDITRTGVQFWGGGAGCAVSAELCISEGNVHLPFGSPEYLGLGVFTFVAFLLCELFGSAFLKHNSIILSITFTFCISMLFTKDGRRYVTGQHIEDSHPLHFLWINTYKLGFYKGAVMPLLGLFLVTYLQATAVLTATAEESRIDISSSEADDNIQGGLMTTALVTLFSALATGLPVMPIAPNSSVPVFSRVASRYVAMGVAFWFLLIGVLGHMMGASLESPAGLYGGIQIPLAVGVILTGLKILSREGWSRRNAMISVYTFSFGLAPILMPSIVSEALWRVGDDPSDFVKSFRMAVITVLQVPYFVGGVVAVVLHLALPPDLEIEPEIRDEAVATEQQVAGNSGGEVAPLRDPLLDETHAL